MTVSPFSSVPLRSEALTLGFASGSACLASCGVLPLPWLTGMRRGWRGTCGLLGIFLGGRLAGYLVFGLGVGLAGRVANLTLGFLFPVGFIIELVRLRGSPPCLIPWMSGWIWTAEAGPRCGSASRCPGTSSSRSPARWRSWIRAWCARSPSSAAPAALGCWCGWITASWPGFR